MSKPCDHRFHIEEDGNLVCSKCGRVVGFGAGPHSWGVVSGGPECNHTMWECWKCGRQVTEVHEH